MLDAEALARGVEGVPPPDRALRWRRVGSRCGCNRARRLLASREFELPRSDGRVVDELRAVVGQHRAHAVRYRCGERLQELGGDAACGALMQLGEGEP